MKIPQQTQRGQRPRVAGRTQRGQSPKGQTRPSEVRAQRATTDPARSEPQGPDKTQRGQSPEGHNGPSVVKGPGWPIRPSVVRGPARSEPSVSVKNRHEHVPQPEGQCASRPVCLLTQPSPVCYHRPRASRSSSRGRDVGLVFPLFAPSFSSLFFRFSVLVSRVFSRSRRCRGCHFGHPRG